MNSYAAPPKHAITYQQWLLNRIAEPGACCGPPVIDDRAWWQYLPALNPYRELEQRARAAERNWAAGTTGLDAGHHCSTGQALEAQLRQAKAGRNRAASSCVSGDRARQPETEAEAG